MFYSADFSLDTYTGFIVSQRLDLDSAPGSYSWIPSLSNHKEFQKVTI